MKYLSWGMLKEKMELDGVPDDMIFVVSSDAEGNSFSPVDTQYNIEYWVPEWSETWHPEESDEDDEEESDSEPPEGAIPCVTLWSGY